MSWITTFFHGNKSESDSVSLLGGNSLGGPISQPEKWASWAIDGLSAEYAPGLSLTGQSFALDWERRKINNINKSFATAIAGVLVHNPLGRIVQLKLGKTLHSNRKFWLMWTMATALVPIAFNAYFMRKTGAWDGQGY